MTGKEMIKIIQDNGLEDFELKTSIYAEDGTDWGFTIQVHLLKGLADIGYSDRTVTFDTTTE